MSLPYIAVDIGNSRIKVGRFEAVRLHPADPLPEPIDSLILNADAVLASKTLPPTLQRWLNVESSMPAGSPNPLSDAPWFLASVNRRLLRRLRTALRQTMTGPIHQLSHTDLPLILRVDMPNRVGIDRLLLAVAVNRIRHSSRPAILIDLGTAITVDLIAADGAFEGGAILPGIGMAAQALAEQTDALPQSRLVELCQPPPAIGKSTLAAIEAGLYWGAIGGIRELIARYSAQLEQVPELFLTGGAAPQVADLFAHAGQPVCYMPNLVLSGIAVVVSTNFTL
ncbi:MAG: type III pantothenate kinase [Pirellulales bacterium]|nr:type III pantothenate kinase [Pirellulales bacterium]